MVTRTLTTTRGKHDEGHQMLQAALAGLPLAGGEVNSIHLDLREDLPLEQWREIGVRLTQLNSTIQWARADWLLYGEHRYGSKAYAEAEVITGLKTQTLANLKYVAAKFTPSRRRENLSWSH